MLPLARALLLTATFAIAVVSRADEATPRIDQAALLKRIDRKDTSTLILDVRTPEEFAKGHVPGAINIPHSHLPARISEIADAADKDIVLYCKTGVRSEQAASRLRENGFTRLLHLDGDMEAWEKHKRPLEK